MVYKSRRNTLDGVPTAQYLVFEAHFWISKNGQIDPFGPPLQETANKSLILSILLYFEMNNSHFSTN